ncbi:hypothetical protein NQ318_021306 [Aromia moschata]|uniref:Mos1 transposase HTH domain-containing protein n=1 Tax=Aromia moschata TaxID=1265417 RepID=A0AAV8ZDE5_9CUCU|nr:hypothetical protein NQ318_021306 [Aromia moschata]
MKNAKSNEEVEVNNIHSGRTFTEAYAMLKEVYGNEYLSRIRVFEWFKWFKEGRETTEDDPRPGFKQLYSQEKKEYFLQID